jgi:hypothetical protein
MSKEKTKELPLLVFLAAFAIFFAVMVAFISTQLETIITAMCLALLFGFGVLGVPSLKSLWHDERGIFVAFSSNLGKNLYLGIVLLITLSSFGLLLGLGILAFLLPPISLAIQVAYSVKNASFEIAPVSLSGVHSVLSETALEAPFNFIVTLCPEWLVDIHFGWLLVLTPILWLVLKYITSSSSERIFAEGEFIKNFSPLLSGFNYVTLATVIAVLGFDWMRNGISGYVVSEVSPALRLVWAGAFLFMMYSFSAFFESILAEVKEAERKSDSRKANEEL